MDANKLESYRSGQEVQKLTRLVFALRMPDLWQAPMDCKNKTQAHKRLRMLQVG